VQEPKAVSRVGFVGGGAIARCHVFAMESMRFYYEDAASVRLALVTSGREERARAFAARFPPCAAVPPEEFWSSAEVDSVFVLSPNALHFEHCRRALSMPSVKRIYVEKPVCVTAGEAAQMSERARTHPHVRIQAGYQLLHMSGMRAARQEWASGALGTPLNFRLSVAHAGYLDAAYRATRATRLSPAPEGGALVDLGSHMLSLAVAFLGQDLEVVGAHALQPFAEIDPRSDMHTLLVLRDRASGAVGTMTATRIAAGHEDSMELEMSGTAGAVRVSSGRPDAYEVCRTAGKQDWLSVRTASDYAPESRFPARAVAAGWLRPLVHAHHVFFTDNRGGSFDTDMAHALAVQRLIQEAVARLG
jgi:predicted dehydrogenase